MRRAGQQRPEPPRASCRRSSLASMANRSNAGEVKSALKEIELLAAHPVPRSQREAVVRNVVERIVGQHLVAHEARKQRIEVLPSDMEADMAQIRQEYQAPDAFDRMLADFRDISRAAATAAASPIGSRPVRRHQDRARGRPQGPIGHLLLLLLLLLLLQGELAAVPGTRNADGKPHPYCFASDGHAGREAGGARQGRRNPGAAPARRGLRRPRSGRVTGS